MNAKPSYPPPTLEDVAWQAKAACHPRADTAIDPERFFPVHKAKAHARAAKRVCSGCPVAPECLEYALRRGLGHGIWGGLSELERRELRRRTAKGSAA